jgi:hypothetical protein
VIHRSYDADFGVCRWSPPLLHTVNANGILSGLSGT